MTEAAALQRIHAFDGKINDAPLLTCIRPELLPFLDIELRQQSTGKVVRENAVCYELVIHPNGEVTRGVDSP